MDGTVSDKPLNDKSGGYRDSGISFQSNLKKTEKNWFVCAFTHSKLSLLLNCFTINICLNICVGAFVTVSDVKSSRA